MRVLIKRVSKLQSIWHNVSKYRVEIMCLLQWRITKQVKYKLFSKVTLLECWSSYKGKHESQLLSYRNTLFWVYDNLHWNQHAFHVNLRNKIYKTCFSHSKSNKKIWDVIMTLNFDIVTLMKVKDQSKLVFGTSCPLG